MKIALAQINSTVGDFSGNAKKIINCINQARHDGARLVVFPELAICGYPPLDLIFKPSFVQANRESIEYIRTHTQDIGAVIGCIDTKSKTSRKLTNASYYICNQKVAGKQYKTLLPTYDVFDEARYFESASEYNLFEIDDIKFGISICEDIWYEKEWQNQGYTCDPIHEISKLNPEFILNLSASPYVIGKENTRLELVKSTAVRFGKPIIYVNQVAGNDELVFDGRSFAVTSEGKVVNCAKCFEEDMIYVEYDQKSKSLLAQNIENQICGTSGIENIYRGLVLGLRDFAQKCGFTKAILGLSGGIDSSVVAAIAVQALGCENVLGVAMPSPYSSEHSINDATRLAQNLKIKFSTVPIADLMNQTVNTLGDSGFKLTKSITFENIQPRLRSLVLMTLANENNYMLLNTGNKSEIACGYCTLYGDMCGAISVIGDLLKTTVYELANFINDANGYDIIPQNILIKRPSAELKENQFDDDTLPPYNVLDKIIELYVEEHLNLSQIQEFGFDIDIIQKVIKLIDNSEFKRKQSPPVIKISKRSFGSGWKMPIAFKYKTILQELSSTS